MQKKEYAAISAPKLGSEPQRKNIDRILVRDYLQLIEIGAFQSEYKVKQRVSFNVSLEVKPQSFPLHDNVDCVLSYDNIIDIINEEVKGGRVDLLETLAEHVALSCLGLEGVLEATVRIEKLDKGAGKLGVEIVRRSSETAKNLLRSRHYRKREANVQKRVPNSGLLFVSSSIFQGDLKDELKDFLLKTKKSWVICFSEIFDRFLQYTGNTNDLKIRLMAISQSAIKFQGEHPEWPLARSITEVSFLLKNKNSCLWCPKIDLVGSELYRSLENSFSYSLAADLARNLLFTDMYILSNDQQAISLKNRFLPANIKVKEIKN